jgi:AGZA family xanthine/uracil permease-like MFS transporter
VTALMFFLSLFLYPLVRMIGGGYPAGDGVVLYPVIAPALILVGTMMMPAVRTIEWDDPTEGIPAFLTMIVMPLTVSITDGIAFGVISHTVLKGVTGRAREVHPLMYAFALVFVLRYAFLVR